MKHSRTTPPRPLDVTSVFPDLAPLAREAIRLHPRPGAPTPYDSSVGGPFLWPADEPWPHCGEQHGWWDEATDEEREGPNPMVAVVQLHLRDVPLLRPPAGADLLQVFWCPVEHEPDFKPPTVLVWRSAEAVTDLLGTPPEPVVVEYDDCYLPVPCLLAPERVTEYPNYLELSPDLQQQLADWGRWPTVGAAVEDFYEPCPQEFYGDALAEAPGWKVGGWAPWGLTDPVARFCETCGAGMTPLLTVASGEWDGSPPAWVPFEDRELAATGPARSANPAGVQVSKGNHLQLYVCPESPEHPHTDLIQ
ncbi:hypothetical protein [Kitasatospora purpeofusca]|uniref:hypothetical protein n=1 Tax=Kitasatospora purpeofusca TaxID=67352 RepID=UPI002256FA83|nr:hypothetical protein [Kitasatospora purpeofusca]MCX4755842.1 hypothetical protein [Kitasatospora purpeofusca]WSR36303.1 hypothetical protein OG715_38340 [Kitasatospora purpeofusca]